MRFPLKINAQGNMVRVSWRGWTRPSINDESIWTGSNRWGDLGWGVISEAMEQIGYHKSWVYVCNNYNAKSQARQILRLYTTKKKGSPKFKNTVTQPVSTKQLMRLKKSPHLQKWTTRKDVDIEEVLEHPFLNMISQVNPILNQAYMWMLTETFMGLTGNAMWWVRRNKLGVPYQIWLLEPQYTIPVLGETIDEYIKRYDYRVGTNVTSFEPESIIHFKYPNPNNQAIGMSPIAGVSDQVRIDEQIQSYSKGLFRNMARPDGVLEVDDELGEEAFKRMKKEWQQMYGGASKAGQVALLEGGAKYKAISMKPRDLGMQEGGKNVMEVISSGYGVPVVLLVPEKANKAVSQVAYAQYMRDTQDPKNKLYEQTINEHLLAMYPEANIFCAFDDCILEDKEFGLKEKESNLKTGYSTINELRKEDGVEPHEGWGDKPILSKNMAEFGGEEEPAEEEEPEKPEEEDEEEEEEKFINKIAERIADRIFKE